jgi:hypothetical protein
MRPHNLLAAPIVAGLVLLLSHQSPAEEVPSKEKIDKLIKQMGSDDFTERDNASKALAAIGVPALEGLRKAAKSEDPEVRKRAEELLPKIERQAESIRVLAPKRVRLVFKDTPLTEALAELHKKTGYSVDLLDPDEKFKERKITLDTGDTTFWRAFALFCEKAELTEVTLEDLMQRQRQPGGIPAQPFRPLPPAKGFGPAGAAPAARPAALQPVGMVMPRAQGMAGSLALNGQIILKDGKPKKLPTDDRSAVRIRALSKSDLLGNAPEGEVILPLEVAPEPRLQWEAFQAIHIDKALDDQNQELRHVIPQVEGAGGGEAAWGPNIPQQMRIRMVRQMQMQRQRHAFRMMGGTFNEQIPVQLKKGAKDAKSLKELKGSITAQLLTEAQPMIVADKLKAGEMVKGKEGGFIKIIDVKSEEEETTIHLEFEQPPFDRVMPAQQNAMQVIGGAAPIRMQARPAGRMLPAQAAPPPLQAQIAIKGGGAAMLFADSVNGLSVLDDKGMPVPVRIQMASRFQQQPGGGFKQTTMYTLISRREKDKGEPAKIAYLGRKRVTVEIPFTLQDVPLP